MKKIKKIKVELLTTQPRYLDTSVCAETFYEIAERWWDDYDCFAHNVTKNFCLKEYHKWKKLAKLFKEV